MQNTKTKQNNTRQRTNWTETEHGHNHIHRHDDQVGGNCKVGVGAWLPPETEVYLGMSRLAPPRDCHWGECGKTETKTKTTHARIGQVKSGREW